MTTLQGPLLPQWHKEWSNYRLKRRRTRYSQFFSSSSSFTSITSLNIPVRKIKHHMVNKIDFQHCFSINAVFSSNTIFRSTPLFSSKGKMNNVEEIISPLFATDPHFRSCDKLKDITVFEEVGLRASFPVDERRRRRRRPRGATCASHTNLAQFRHYFMRHFFLFRFL